MNKIIKEKTELVNRSDFRFLKAYYYVLIQLKSDTDKLNFLMSIINRQFTGEEPMLEGDAAFAYAAIKYHVDASLTGFKFKVGIDNPTEPPTLPPTEPPLHPPTEVSPTLPPTAQEERKKKKEESNNEEKKQKKNEPNGFEKLLEVFPTNKVHSEHECLAIWDSLTQDEKKKVIKHSIVYVRELVKKNETQYMKNLKAYLESRVWSNVSTSTKNKDYGRGMTKGGIDGKFVQWMSRITKTTFDESIKELALMSDEDYKEIRSMYEEEIQNG